VLAGVIGPACSIGPVEIGQKWSLGIIRPGPYIPINAVLAYKRVIFKENILIQVWRSDAQIQPRINNTGMLS